jgi:hypothetical protein
MWRFSRGVLAGIAAAVTLAATGRPASAQQPPGAGGATGYLAIAGINNGPASVTVNGRPRGQLTTGEMTLQLPAGPYEVVVSKRGFNACRRPVTVPANDLVRVVCTLTPVAARIVSDASQTGAAAQQTRTIRVIHLEPSAVPIVVGTDRGTTPATVQLPVGDDTILLNGQPLCLRVAPPSNVTDTDTLRLIVRAGTPQLVQGVRMCGADAVTLPDDPVQLTILGTQHESRGDMARAGQLYKRACDRGGAAGCVKLGLLYENKEGAEHDYQRAIRLYEQACAARNADGCFYEGTLYESGRGVVRNLSRARDLYAQACALGSPSACANKGP